jgi:predicted P-loop ATPase
MSKLKPPPEYIEPKTDDETPSDDKKKGEKGENYDLEKVIEYLEARFEFKINILTDKTIFRELGEPEFRDFNDRAFKTLLKQMKRAKLKVNRETLDMLTDGEDVEVFNPIIDYFENLPPAGGGHIDKLAGTVTLANPEFVQHWKALFRRWILAAAACVMGRKINDVCLVLASGQGTGKTTWLNALVPPALTPYRVIGHITPSLTDNNTANYLAEKLLINIDDQLDGILRKDFEGLKSIISAPDVTNRKAYAREAVQRKRIASFCASVNSMNFLTDVENRRYLVFEIKEIEWNHKVDINAVWVEAFHLIKQGAQYWFDKKDLEAMYEMNKVFAEVTTEQEMLSLTYLPDDAGAFVLPSEVLKVLNRRMDGLKLNDRKLARAFERLGFTKIAKKINGNSQRGYLVRYIGDAANAPDLAPTDDFQPTPPKAPF